MEDHAKLKCANISKVLVPSEFVKGSSGRPVFLSGGCVFSRQEPTRNYVEYSSIVRIYFYATARSPRGQADFPQSQILGVHSPTLGGPLADPRIFAAFLRRAATA